MGVVLCRRNSVLVHVIAGRLHTIVDARLTIFVILLAVFAHVPQATEQALIPLVGHEFNGEAVLEDLHKVVWPLEVVVGVETVTVARPSSMR